MLYSKSVLVILAHEKPHFMTGSNHDLFVYAYIISALFAAHSMARIRKVLFFKLFHIAVLFLIFSIIKNFATFMCPGIRVILLRPPLVWISFSKYSSF